MGLDYSTHLRVSNDSVLLMVDHLTRMAYFLLCTESVTRKGSTILILIGVYRLHGLHRVLVKDRDANFISGFWQTLWRRLGTRLTMSSSRHPETDGLTERVNNIFWQLLRCFSGCDG
jgi:hypothetical protein